MNKFTLIAITILLSSCASIGSIEVDDASLYKVKEDMSVVISNIENGSYFEMGGHSIIDKYGYRYSVGINQEQIQVTVYDMVRNVSIFSNCIIYFKYQSAGYFGNHKIIKRIDNWALIEACRA